VGLADGWCPFSLSPAEAAEWLGTMELPVGFEVVLPPTARLEPIAEPDRTQEILAETAGFGATTVSCGFQHNSIEEYLDKLEALSLVHAAMETP
jgi:hypothetical protein